LRFIYNIVPGLVLTAVSEENMIDVIRFRMRVKKSASNNAADPRKDAKNVLKNDFIIKKY